jgi:hypothetical protein
MYCISTKSGEVEVIFDNLVPTPTRRRSHAFVCFAILQGAVSGCLMLAGNRQQTSKHLSRAVSFCGVRTSVFSISGNRSRSFLGECELCCLLARRIFSNKQAPSTPPNTSLCAFGELRNSENSPGTTKKKRGNGFWSSVEAVTHGIFCREATAFRSRCQDCA